MVYFAIILCSILIFYLLGFVYSYCNSIALFFPGCLFLDVGRRIHGFHDGYLAISSSYHERNDLTFIYGMG